jgi:ABC-type enterochelin transport system permease subunit
MFSLLFMLDATLFKYLWIKIIFTLAIAGTAIFLHIFEQKKITHNKAESSDTKF